MNKPNFLALDLATKCGWATEHGSGVWDLSVRPDESDGMRVVRFAAKLRETVAALGINSVVVYERATGTAGRERATVTHAELQGSLKLMKDELGFEYKGYSPKEIKKHATGKGNSNKDAMIAAAKERWPGIQIIDDNHADALWLLDLAKTHLS